MPPFCLACRRAHGVQEQTHLPAHAPLAAGGTNDQRVSLQDSLQGTTTRVSVHNHWACGVVWACLLPLVRRGGRSGVQLVGECCTRACIDCMSVCVEVAIASKIPDTTVMRSTASGTVVRAQ